MVWEDEVTLPEAAGVRVPKWAVYALLVALVLLTAGFRMGVVVADHMATTADTARRVNEIDVRMCRLEASNNLPRWPTCDPNIYSSLTRSHR